MWPWFEFHRGINGRSNDGRRYPFWDQDRELFDNDEDDNNDAKVIVEKNISRSDRSYDGPPRREPAAPSRKVKWRERATDKVIAQMAVIQSGDPAVVDILIKKMNSLR